MWASDVDFVINFKSPTHQVILSYAFLFASIIFVPNVSIALLISTLKGVFLAKSKWMILEFKVREGKTSQSPNSDEVIVKFLETIDVCKFIHVTF